MKVTLPCPARKPPNNMIASLGTGMQALSSTMSRNTAVMPYDPIMSVAQLTIGAVRSGNARPHARDQTNQDSGPLIASIST